MNIRVVGFKIIERFNNRAFILVILKTLYFWTHKSNLQIYEFLRVFKDLFTLNPLRENAVYNLGLHDLSRATVSKPVLRALRLYEAGPKDDSRPR